MSDEWDFYSVRVDGELASIALDMGIAPSAPISGYKHRGHLRVSMLEPREDGLSNQTEFEVLSALEDEATSRIIAAGQAIYVGRWTSGGNRDFHYYLRDGENFKIAANAAMALFPAYKFEIVVASDPDWQFYFDNLHPPLVERQHLSNRSVVENLIEYGDRLDEPRLIDHLAVFADRKGCAAFIELVKSQGYVVQDDPKITEDNEVRLTFSRVDQPSRIDNVTLPLFKAAKNYGGQYDGWGCKIVR
jgi:hypothetical protein